jgi:hypothetical protein
MTSRTASGGVASLDLYVRVQLLINAGAPSTR